MKKRWSIPLILGLCILMVLAILSGIVCYYYFNPSKWKPLLESTVSGFTGTECSIEEISWSRKPLSIRARGIQLIDHLESFQLGVHEISAALSIQGPIGGRRLIFQNLKINGFTLTLPEGWRFSEAKRGGQGGSLLGRLMGKVFSFLAFRDIAILEASLKDGHLSGRWGDRKVTLNGIHATLTPERFLEVVFGAHLLSLADHLDLKLPRLKLITEHPVELSALGIQVILAGDEISFETRQGKVTEAVLAARIAYRQQEKTLDVESLKISFGAISFPAQGGNRLLSLGSFIEARGGLDFQKGTLAAPLIRAVFRDLAEFRGELRADLLGNQGVIVKAGDLKLRPQGFFPMLPEPMKEKLKGIVFDGDIAVRGQVKGRLGEGLERWTCDLKALLVGNQVALSSAGDFFRAAASGEVRLKGSLLNPEISLTLEADAPEARVGGMEIGQMEAALSIQGIHPAFDIQEIRVRTVGAKWPAKDGSLSVSDIEVRGGKGTLDLQSKSLRLPELMLHTSTLKNLVLSLEMAGEGISLSAKGENVGISEFAQSTGLLPPGLRVTCKDSLHGQLLLEGDGRITVDANLDVQALSFESDDGLFLGENISLSARPALQGKIGNEIELDTTLSLNCGQGEILYDRFYLDFKKNTLIATGKGTYASGSGAIDISELTFYLKDLASLAVKGTLSGEKSGTSRVLARIDKIPLEPVFRQFVVEPHKHRNPLLSDLHLGGFFSAELELLGGEGLWTLKGRSLWREGQASVEKQGILLQGIELDLPIWYERSARGLKKKGSILRDPVALEGSLFIQSAQVPFLLEQPMSTLLMADPEKLYTKSPVLIMTEGGGVDIGGIIIRDAFSGTPDLETSLTLGRLDLGPWLSRLWPAAVEGSLQGKLDPVRWQGGAVLTKGELVADLFGGRVRVSNLGAKMVPSLTPMIHLDAVWENIDLAQITRDTAFGKIEGTLRGQVKGLEVADGQPQAFHLTAETLKTKNTQQRISVQAVDNIARIGGGASPFSGLTGAFVSFFRELPYEKIGVKASLENDVFRINGTIRENGKEYLIKKGGFSGVDVIIGTPGSNTISFKDMLRRIKRITSSHESTVVE